MPRRLRFWLFVAGAGGAVLGIVALAYVALTEPLRGNLKIGFDRANSESREMANAIASVVARVHPHLRISPVETSGSGENARLLWEREIDLALVEGDAILRQNVALVAVLYPNLFQLLVRGDSGIESVNDLAGRRIALPPVTSDEFRAFWFLANHYGVPPERLDAVPMSLEEAGQALLNGEVDALFRVAGARNEQIRRLVNEAARVRLLPIDQGEAMHLREPAYRASTLPKGAYRGDLPMPAQDLPTLAVDRLLVARTGVANDAVRAITSVLFENRRDLALRMPLATFITQPSISTGTLMPVHPGALEYYEREQPSFLEAKAEFLALLLSLAVVIGSILLAAKRRLDDRKKARIEDYAAELLEVEKAAKACPTIPDLNKQKDRLTELLSRVVEDMRARRVNAEGLQLFAFIWESVNYTVNDHEEQLRLGPDVHANLRAARRLGSGLSIEQDASP